MWMAKWHLTNKPFLCLQLGERDECREEGNANSNWKCESAHRSYEIWKVWSAWERPISVFLLPKSNPALLHTDSSKRDHYLSGWAQTRCFRFLILFFVWSTEIGFTSVTGLLTGNSLLPMDWLPLLIKVWMRGWENVCKWDVINKICGKLEFCIH